MTKKRLRVVRPGETDATSGAKQADRTELELFRGVVLSMAEKALEAADALGYAHPEAAGDEYRVLCDYLDHLVRLCKGEA